MQRTYNSTTLYYRHLIVRATLLSSILLCAAIGFSATASAESVPGGNVSNPVIRAVDIAKPAVVRIITRVGGRLTVFFNDANSATFPRSGGRYKLASSGTGTFISSHGDILTANHVIKPPKDQGLDEALIHEASPDVADYINATFQVTEPYTPQQAESAMLGGYFRTSSNYSDPTSEVYLSTDYTGPLDAKTLDGLPTGIHTPVQEIKKESPFNEADLAIVKVALEDTPAVQLSNSLNVAQQDELTIIGFPGNGDISEDNDPTQFLTSSVNKVYVSALKKTDGGVSVIQIGGNVEHGDSGGPALDSKGNIVGIVSFGLAKSMPMGTTFLQTSNNALKMIDSIKLDTTPGSFQKTWRQAFADYTSNSPGHWSKAEQGFRQLATKYKNFDAVQPYTDYAKEQAAKEKVPTTTNGQPNVNYGLILGIVALLLALVVIVVITMIILRNRRRTLPSLPYQPAGNTIPYQNSFASQTSGPVYPNTVAPPPYQAPAVYTGQSGSSYPVHNNTLKSFEEPTYPTPERAMQGYTFEEESAKTPSQPIQASSFEEQVALPHTPVQGIPFDEPTYRPGPSTPVGSKEPSKPLSERVGHKAPSRPLASPPQVNGVPQEDWPAASSYPLGPTTPPRPREQIAQHTGSNPVWPEKPAWLQKWEAEFSESNGTNQQSDP